MNLNKADGVIQKSLKGKWATFEHVICVCMYVLCNELTYWDLGKMFANIVLIHAKYTLCINKGKLFDRIIFSDHFRKIIIFL